MAFAGSATHIGNNSKTNNKIEFCMKFFIIPDFDIISIFYTQFLKANEEFILYEMIHKIIVQIDECFAPDFQCWDGMQFWY